MKLPDGTTVNKYYSVASYGVRRAVRAATWPSREPGKTENTEPVAGESAEQISAGERRTDECGGSAEPTNAERAPNQSNVKRAEAVGNHEPSVGP
jgi:hypothetical protein